MYHIYTSTSVLLFIMPNKIINLYYQITWPEEDAASDTDHTDTTITITTTVTTAEAAEEQSTQAQYSE